MSEAEYLEKQRKLVSELYQYVTHHSVSINDRRSCIEFEFKLREIFKLECDKMGIHYSSKGEKKNDIDFYICNLPEANWKGQFSNVVGVNRDGSYIEDARPLIELNFATMDFKRLSFKSKEDKLYGCREILKTLFHEIRHFRQFKIATSNINSRKSLKYAKDFVVGDINFLVPNFKNKIYDNNHDSFVIEADAEYQAHLKTNKVSNKKEDRDTNIAKICKFDIEYSDICVEDDKGHKFVYDRDMYFDFCLDNLLTTCNKQGLLNTFPILKREYNPDGTRKDFYTLYSDMQSEVKRISNSNIKNKSTYLKMTRELYYELIYKQVKDFSNVQVRMASIKLGQDNMHKLFSEMNVFFKREMKSRKSMAYEKKEALKHLKSGENYISKNLRGVKVDNGNNEVLVKNSEYFDVMNVRWLYNIQHIIQHVRVRLPYCGIYMLHNGSKITPKEFIEKYVIPNAYYIDNEMDYDTFLRKHVKSTEETEYLLDLERINSEFQRKRDKLDNFDKSLDRHFSLFKTKKGKHEMKDKYFREELEIMQGIIDLVHSDGKNNYLLENIRGQINYDPSCEDFCYFVFSSSEKRLMKKIIDVSYALTHDKLLNPEQINYYYKLKGIQEFRDKLTLLNGNYVQTSGRRAM